VERDNPAVVCHVDALVMLERSGDERKAARFSASSDSQSILRGDATTRVSLNLVSGLGTLSVANMVAQDRRDMLCRTRMFELDDGNR
jgi:hypothetical protein